MITRAGGKAVTCRDESMNGGEGSCSNFLWGLREWKRGSPGVMMGFKAFVVHVDLKKIKKDAAEVYLY